MNASATCPKCRAPRSAGPECPHCGVVYAKAEAAAIERAAAAAREADERALAEKRQAEREATEKNKALRQRNAKMNPCASCGATIARSASSCPHCGAKQKKAVGKAGLALAGVFIVAMIVSIARQTPQESASEQAERLMREHSEIAAKATANIACMKYLKAQLRDPESLVVDALEQASETPAKDGSVTVYTTIAIRARNGFGGMNRESYICEASINGLAFEIKHFSKTRT